ncbi:MAG: glycosyltransferase family 39 protein [Candidatus Heimdallarchaeota archaeon]|nr:glycosyltransferase family 39 protein [Candidatus Heimdallarchaeota archaeon]
MENKELLEFDQQNIPLDQEIITVQFLTRQSQKLLQREIFKRIFSSLPLVTIIFISLIIRVIASGKSRGFIHPDEVFQSIEMVHYHIFGEYGTGQTIPWEFNEEYEYGGARSWFFVFILVAIYRFVMLFGITDPLMLIGSARLFLSLLSVITVIIAYKLGSEIFNKRVGLLSAFLCGIWWFFPFWASRIMTDSISSDMLFISIYLTYKAIKYDSIKKKLLTAFFAGIFVGLAFMFRFPSGLMGIPLFIALLYVASKKVHGMKKKDCPHKRNEYFLPFIPMIMLFLGGGLMIIAQGIMDLFTWGDFLQSPINFFMYNIVEGNSAHHGTAPWYAYLLGFFYDFGNYFILAFFLFFVFGLFYNKKWKSKIFFGAIFIFWLVLFSILAHKEFRFIFILLPFSMIFVSNGMDTILKFIRKKSLQNFLLGAFIIFFCASSYTMGVYQKSYYWNYAEGICTAMYWVGKQDDTERLAVFENVWYTGGYAYLDKDVPCYFLSMKPWINPSETYNSTYYRTLFATPGTYAIVKSIELAYLEEIFLSCGMQEVLFLYDNPSVTVYAKK